MHYGTLGAWGWGQAGGSGAKGMCPPRPPNPCAWGLVSSSWAPAHRSPPGTAFVLDAGPAGVAATRPTLGALLSS